MELLKQHLNEIQIPTAHTKVYKDECVFSFDNPVSYNLWVMFKKIKFDCFLI